MSQAQATFATPLLRLARFAPEGPVYAKLEHLQPTGSIYDRLAEAIVGAHAEAIARATRVIVAGSGSVCLAFAGALSNLRAWRTERAPGPEVLMILPEDTLAEHRILLAKHPVTVAGSESGLGLTGASRRASAESAARGGLVLYTPQGSALAEDAFAATVGRELTGIAAQHGLPAPAAVIAPFDTPDLLRGVARALGGRGPVTCVGTVGVVDGGTSRQDGARTWGEVGAPPDIELVAVSDGDAFAARAELARKEGLLVGLASAGAIQVARARSQDGPTQIAIVIDAGDRYFSVDHHFAGLAGEAR